MIVKYVVVDTRFNIVSQEFSHYSTANHDIRDNYNQRNWGSDESFEEYQKNFIILPILKEDTRL